MDLAQGFAKILVQVTKDAGHEVDPENVDHQIRALLVAGAMLGFRAGLSPDGFAAMALGSFEGLCASLNADISKCPKSKFRCSVCSEPQYETPGGLCCLNGHGGASSIDEILDHDQGVIAKIPSDGHPF